MEAETSCSGVLGLIIRLVISILVLLLPSLGYPAEQDAVVLQVDKSVKAVLQKAIEPIVESARLDDLGDVQQLYRRIRPTLINVLGAQGYFAATVRRNRDKDEEDPLPLKVFVDIDIGKQSVIKGVNIQFEGHIARDEEPQITRRSRLVAGWALKEGMAFSQSAWSNSKDAILSNLLANDYPSATVSASLADVDVDNQAVYLNATFDSGPAFTFGDLQVQGMEKYPADLVDRYNPIEAGDPYSQEKLLDFLSSLQQTPYFSGVDVLINPDPNNPVRVPIEVQVAEGKTKRLGLGTGYSTNTGFRVEAAYDDYNLFGRAYSLASGVRLEQKRQSAFADVFLPPSRADYRDAIGVSVDYQDLGGLDVERRGVGIRRDYVLKYGSLAVGLNYQMEDRRTNTGVVTKAQALVSSAAWQHLRVDDRLNPTRGYVLQGQVAAASENVLADQDFIRLAGKAVHYFSINKSNQITSRFELGSVFADSRNQIPQDYLFRTGGASTLRGYKFLSVGVPIDGVVQGGRRLGIASVEYTHWFGGGLGAAAFTDYGDVSANWSDFDPQPSVGIGARYRTPAGPVALDIAKAKGQTGVEIHFALGVTF